METLLIIADDFTGALDTGVKFAQRGTVVRVVTDYKYDFTELPMDVQVLVMDAETRHIAPNKAYARILEIGKRAVAAGITYLYKKTDSALRGNIGSELTALLDATAEKGNPILHFVPALPEMGRTTKNGVHYIDGVPVKDSVFGQDPFEPVTCSYIPDVICPQSDVNVRVICDGTILEKADVPTIAVYDAQTDEEIQAIANALGKAGKLFLLAGCAGLAQMLPDLLRLPRNSLYTPQFVPQFLVACGSVNPITQKQLDYAQQNGFYRIRLMPEQKLDAKYFESIEGKAKLQEILNRCKRERLCILDMNDEENGSDTLTYAAEREIGIEQVRVQITKTLGYILKYLVEEQVESTMMITGGDSLLGFMDQVGVYEMTPVCEMAPGTVLSTFMVGKKEYQVISKSGGFGSEKLMTDLAKILDEKRSEHYVRQL